jgi:hypothetical protein
MGVLVAVREKDAAGLQHGEERSLSGFSKRRKERVGALVHAQLQCCRIVRDASHLLHGACNTLTVTFAAMQNVSTSSRSNEESSVLNPTRSFIETTIVERGRQDLQVEKQW